MDVINAAKKISEAGTKLNALAKQIADEVRTFCDLTLPRGLHFLILERRIGDEERSASLLGSYHAVLSSVERDVQGEGRRATSR